MTKTDIVIVNWNGGRYLAECVASIAAYGDGLVGKVTVVDNGSTDGSLAALASYPTIDIVRLADNRGFAKASNLGAARGDSPYLLFFNPDARLLPGTLRTALAFMESPSALEYGVVGVRLVGEDGEAQRHCACFPSAGYFLCQSLGLRRFAARWGYRFMMTAFDHQTSRDVDHVMGAFYLMRRSLYRMLGGFDERFFVYLEDLDLSLRVHQAGYRVHYLAEATAFHKSGASTGQVKARRLYYSLSTRAQYAFKHYPPGQAWLVTAAAATVEFALCMALALLRRSMQGAGDTWRGYRLFWGALGRIARGEPAGPADEPDQQP